VCVLVGEGVFIVYVKYYYQSFVNLNHFEMLNDSSRF
jgi:hypothetical protein